MFRWDATERTLRPLTNRPVGLEHGHCYRMTPEEDRNWAFHRAYFAQIRDLWQTLPETAALEPWARSPEALRKYALIRTGHCTCTTHACETKAEAMRTARIIQAEADEFTVVVPRGSVVEVYRAKSQDGRMKRDEFNETSEAVLRFIGEIVGVDA